MDEGYYTHALAAAAMRLLEQRLIRTIIVADAGAGNDFRVTVPGGTAWELLSAHYVFTASAVVATRILGLDILDADLTRRSRFLTTAGVTAGANFDYSWDSGLGDSNETQGRSHSLPSPPYILQNGWSIQSRTIAKDAGDTYTQVSLQVRSWSELDVIQEMQELGSNMDSLTSRLVGTGG